MVEPRRTYHHGELREALIRTGLDLAREGGPEAVVLREAARRQAVSATAAYRHFSARSDLLDAVRERATRLLGASMTRARDAARRDVPPGRNAPLQDLRMLGRAYVEFALAEPGLFRFMAAVPAQSPRAAPKGDDPAGLLGDALDRMVQEGLLAPADRPGSEIAAWAAVHGLAVLLSDGALEHVRLGGAPLIEAATNRVLDVVAYGLLPRSPSSPQAG